LTGVLALDGEGTVRVERDVLVLEGNVWRGQRLRYLAYGIWASFVVVLGAYLALVRPELLASVVAVSAACAGIHKLADRANATQRI